MKTKITTVLFLLSSVGFALAGEGSQFQPIPANKQAPVVAHACDEHTTGKHRPRTPRARSGHRTASLQTCANHAQPGAFVASDWTRHHKN